MARGTSKQKSLDQENYVAKALDGRRSPSSGAADTDAGDVRTPFTLIECKCTGVPGHVKQPKHPSFNQMIAWLEKVSEEAWEEGKDPALAYRFYNPSSRFAKTSGWVDILIRPLDDAGDTSE